MTVASDNEIWLPIPGLAYYEASDKGRIRSLPRVIVRRDGRRHTYTGTVLSAAPRSNGYPMVSVRESGAKRHKLAHRLVMLAFYGRPPVDKPYVNHKDGVRTNNAIENLEYVSPLENVRHAITAGLTRVPRGEECSNVVLTAAQVLEIRAEVRRLRATGRAPHRSMLALSKKYGISTQQVDHVARGHSWSHI